ncbi:hypothetical protein KUV50_06480 [Membranicola marinus]|uniref:Uncharacterized protein n=1 Tax=Membranihabitans marinus TaxID=1227546 RepID=A0A953HXY9_9BACT|nr:hypothetical protein [Membranihabitans marinus]MBY5957767.1 hypothetical protein [Membranihabitans marinus]
MFIYIPLKQKPIDAEHKTGQRLLGIGYIVRHRHEGPDIRRNKINGKECENEMN